MQQQQQRNKNRVHHSIEAWLFSLGSPILFPVSCGYFQNKFFPQHKYAAAKSAIKMDLIAVVLQFHRRESLLHLLSHWSMYFPSSSEREIWKFDRNLNRHENILSADLNAKWKSVRNWDTRWLDFIGKFSWKKMLTIIPILLWKRSYRVHVGVDFLHKFSTREFSLLSICIFHSLSSWFHYFSLLSFHWSDEWLNSRSKIVERLNWNSFLDAFSEIHS